jgi:hypothetical protein
MLVKDYQSTLRSTSEGRSSHHHRGGSFKSRAVVTHLELLLKNMPEGAHEAQEEFKLKDNPPLD